MAIFWVAFLLRVLSILVGHTYRIRLDDGHFDFGFEAGRIARSLVTGHGYANPFNGNSGPTAWLPPLYPLLMALAFRLFGVYSRSAAFFLMALHSLFSALIAPAVYEIAARCFDARGTARRRSTRPAPVALWSAWMWALYPAAMQYAVHWVWEMSLSACLFSWALVVALRLRGTGDRAAHAQTLSGAVSAYAPPETRSKAWRSGLWLRLGLLWGGIALSNASLLLVFPASILWIAWPGWRGSARAEALQRVLAGTGIAGFLFAAMLTPWVLRNEHALHAFVPTRSNFGIEFWHSTQFAENGPIPWGTAMPLSARDPEFKRYIAEGEIRYARDKDELARRNLRAHPGLFARYTLERVQFFWACTPHPEDRHPVVEYLRVLQYSFTSLAGLLGLALMLRRGVPGAGLFALAFALVPLVYYAITVQPRFRHPLEPLIAICAVYLFRSTGKSSFRTPRQ